MISIQFYIDNLVIHTNMDNKHLDHTLKTNLDNIWLSILY